MKRKALFMTIFGVLGFFLLFQGLPLHAEKTSKALTVLYSNNINGEIDPCPT
jgi:hypothetical protein